MAPTSNVMPTLIPSIPTPPDQPYFPANLVDAISKISNPNIVVSSPIFPFKPLKSKSTTSFKILIRILILTTVVRTPIPPENDILPIMVVTNPRIIIRPASNVQLMMSWFISPDKEFSSLRAFTMMIILVANTSIFTASVGSNLLLPELLNSLITNATINNPATSLASTATLSFTFVGSNDSIAFNATTINVIDPVKLRSVKANFEDPLPIYLFINSIPARAATNAASAIPSAIPDFIS